MAQSSTTVPSTGLVKFICENRKNAGMLQLVLAGLVAVAAAFFFFEWRRSGGVIDGDEKSPLKSLEKKDDLDPLSGKKAEKPEKPRNDAVKLFSIWLALVAMILAAGALSMLAMEPSPGTGPIVARQHLTIVLGCLGVVTVLYGLAILYREQAGILAWLGQGENDKARGVLLGLSVFIAGLGLLFISVLPARAAERHNPMLRRLVYSTNTLLVGLLLLLALIMGNVFVGMNVDTQIDATERKFYSLEPTSAELLASIEEPMHAYFFCPTELPGNLYKDFKALLANCKAANPNFKYDLLVPGTDDDAFNKLRERLKITPEETRDGGRAWGFLIVTIGENEDRKAVLRVRPDMITTEPKPRKKNASPQEEERDDIIVQFKGEVVLINELNALSQTSGKKFVYFTQGNGEIEIEGETDRNRSIELLRRYLTDRKYESKPLRYEFNKPFVIPADAAVVVVLGPKQKIPLPMQKALHDYTMPEKPGVTPGKLILALPPFKNVEGEKISETGFETLLIDAGIIPSVTRLYNPLQGQNGISPQMIIARGNGRLSQLGHPLARVVKSQYFINDTRYLTVQQARTQKYQPVPLIGINREIPTWLDPNMTVDALAITEKLLDDKNPKAAEKFEEEKQFAMRSDPLAIAVMESSGPPNPMAPPVLGKPLFIVFGSESLFTDQGLQGVRKFQPDAAETNFALFTGMLDYLRDRPASIGIKPRVHDFVSLDNEVDEGRLLLSPWFWQSLAIIGLGLVVWVIRRK